MPLGDWVNRDTTLWPLCKLALILIPVGFICNVLSAQWSLTCARHIRSDISDVIIYKHLLENYCPQSRHMNSVTEHNPTMLPWRLATNSSQGQWLHWIVPQPNSANNYLEGRLNAPRYLLPADAGYCLDLGVLPSCVSDLHGPAFQ